MDTRRWHAAIVENLPKRTGKSLLEWHALIRARQFRRVGEAISWLRGEHGLKLSAASVIATDFFHPYDDAAAMLDDLYRGANGRLRPIYDALRHLARDLGPDVTLRQHETMTELVRGNPFATLTPVQGEQLELALALVGVSAALPARLVAQGGARLTHRFELTSVAELDAEVEYWLRVAYERAAGPDSPPGA